MLLTASEFADIASLSVNDRFFVEKRFAGMSQTLPQWIASVEQDIKIPAHLIEENSSQTTENTPPKSEKK